MSKDKKLELYDLEAIQITDKKHAEDILKELLEEEFAMSYSMVLFKVELVELTNKNRYKCVILFGTDIESDIRRMSILIDANDLNNEIQLTNYLNIVRKNPSTRFTLWTKRYSLVEKYFTEHDVPDNFTLIISSLMINTKISLTFLKKTGKFKLGQLKSFTVYDYDYIKEHWKEMDINCGSRFCLGCRLCYDLNDVEEISEVLKADQIRVDKFLKCNDSKLIEEQLELLSDLDDLL